MFLESIDMLPASLHLAATNEGAYWVLLGRLHPMLVHFPIALILVAAVLELVLLVRRPERPSPTASLCVWVGTIFACLSIWCGWALGEESGGGDVLELHRWFGVGAGGVLLAVTVCWLIERASQARWSFQSYRFGLWGGAVLLVITSSFGGDLVWGDNWLTGPLTAQASVESEPSDPSDPSEPSEPDQATQAQEPVTPQASMLESDVVALFTERCEQCHGPTKQRGDLQLIPLHMVFPEGNDVTAMVDPDNPDASELYKRITLPEDHDDRMPPKGEPLTAEEVALVRNWIAAGAPHGPQQEQPAQEVAANDEPPVISDAAAFDAALQAIIDRGGVVTALHQGSDWYEVNVSIARPVWTDSDLDLLKPIAGNLWSLNLGRSAVTDAGMAAVADCTGLRVLKLNGTSIGDAGVQSLAGLKSLQRLNLYGTQVGDGSVDTIEALPALTHVYLWDTRVTRLGIDTLRVGRPNMKVDAGAGLGAPPPEEAPEPAPEAPPASDPAEPETETAAVTLPPCCQVAADRGQECDHVCCVDARAQGEICSKCAVVG